MSAQFPMLLAAGTHEFPLITLIAAAFAAAWLMGIITQWLRLSPIVGYLVAGILIGPYTPGFVGDATLAPQLAELGVILLMFGVGLHFHLGDLLAVRRVAIPGALGQSLAATLLGALVALLFGWHLNSGLVLGMAMAVASTVVLVRVLTDNRKLDTTEGHVAVGWLIVEDLLTVVVLVLIPALAQATGSHAPAAAAVATDAVAATTQVATTLPATLPVSAEETFTGQHPLVALLIAFAKLGVMVVILLVGGGKVVPWLMVRVARLRSRELFTLTVLVMAIGLTTFVGYAFGASLALGAFLAGMVVGRSPVSAQAGADALPLRDAFAVLFFASVGMLFDPRFILQEPLLMIAGLTIVLIGKPLAALLIVAIIGYPARTAVTVAVALAQVGEFSFILSDLGRANGLLDDTAHNLIVACSIVSITLNPILFKQIPRIETFLQKFPRLWRFMNRRNIARQEAMAVETEATLQKSESPLAVIVGYGPVGRTVDRVLRDRGVETVVVDLNMDTIRSLNAQGRLAIYGDAFNIEVLSQAMPRATHLLVTLPHAENRNPLVISAKLLNPNVKVFVRARYMAEREELEQAGADAICFEEAEAAVALARLVLSDAGADADQIRQQTQQIRHELHLAG